MDASLYKDLTVSRGIKYRYYASPATSGKPTVLLAHGFPSTSYDFHRLVEYFQPKGYGVIVPDQLGYAGTDKPEDPAAYTGSLLAQDMIDILDAEKIQKAFAVGHDWGTKVVARLANYHPDRFHGFGFLAVGYVPPRTEFNLDQANAMMKQIIGYETFGYWSFFSEEGAEDLIDSNWELFLNILFPDDPAIWKENVTGTGQLKRALTEKRSFPPASYLTEEERSHILKTLKAQSIKAPLNYYKVMTRGLQAEDDKAIPKERYPVTLPVFFGAALKDYVCVAATQKPTIAQLCPNATIKDYDGDHWIIFSHAEQLGADLQAWIDTSLKDADAQGKL